MVGSDASESQTIRSIIQAFDAMGLGWFQRPSEYALESRPKIGEHDGKVRIARPFHFTKDRDEMANL
jgi:hypothetical protein